MTRAGRLRATIAGGVALFVVGTLVAGFALAGRHDARADLRAQQERTADAVSARAEARAREVAAHEAVDRSMLARDAARQAYDESQADLDTARRQAVEAEGQLVTQSGRVDAGARCTAAVRIALYANAAGDPLGAVRALRDQGRACQDAVGGGVDGAVFPFDFPDPYVLATPDGYYAYATNAIGGAVQVIRSPDLATWEFAGDALPISAAWSTRGRTWAPAVMARLGGYVLYYSTHHAASGQQCISRATSISPGGPFVDDSLGPMVCGGRDAIDPSPFVDVDGTPYLLWKSENPPRLWSQQLSPDGRGLVGSPHALLRAGQRWEGTNVEAPSLARMGDTYWLFYSGNRWDGAGYAQGVARCRSPRGPCTKPLDGPILGSGGGRVAPGGGEAFLDRHGRWWLAYHAYRAGELGWPGSRRIYLTPLRTDGDVPRPA